MQNTETQGEEPVTGSPFILKLSVERLDEDNNNGNSEDHDSKPKALEGDENNTDGLILKETRYH